MDRTPDSRRPGRPRQFDSDDAIQAALQLFWHKGYQQTTTRDLEKALGVAQSSIYNIVGSKKNLLDVSLQRYETMLGNSMLPPLVAEDAGLDDIADFFENMRRWTTNEGRRGCLLFNLMSDYVEASPSVTQRCDDFVDAFKSVFKNILDREVANGHVRKNLNVEHSVSLILGLALGLNALAKKEVPAAEMDSFVAGAKDTVLAWRQQPN